MRTTNDNKPYCYTGKNENYSKDNLDDMFGANSQCPHHFIFISTNNEDSQDSRTSQVKVLVCYMLYVVVYQYKEQLTIVSIEFIEYA